MAINDNQSDKGLEAAPKCKIKFFIEAVHTLTLLDFAMAYFRITLIRSAIGLPKKSRGVLAALGLRKRMRTVFHPVSPDVAGQIMKVKELVAVSEVDRALTKQELHLERKPDPGYYVEQRGEDVWRMKREA